MAELTDTLIPAKVVQHMLSGFGNPHISGQHAAVNSGSPHRLGLNPTIVGARDAQNGLNKLRHTARVGMMCGGSGTSSSGTELVVTRCAIFSLPAGSVQHGEWPAWHLQAEADAGWKLRHDFGFVNVACR